MANPELINFEALRARLASFDAIIDARSEAEYAEDRLPGAVNHPTLDTTERATVGTLYKESPFEARKVGAAMAARNIARHIETAFAQHPQSWKPLVYCWRGGNRSNAMAHILARVGWQVTILAGGYKDFRRAVLHDLAVLPASLHYRVVCGPTGSGKSRLLRALAAQGNQVLDLEELAAHRGSVLGGLPDQAQPGQRAFETAIWGALQTFSPERPVFVEAESRQIGKLRIPEPLLNCMRASPCVLVELAIGERVRLLADEYRHLIEQPARLAAQLDGLSMLHGHLVIDGWHDLIERGAWDELVADLLERHYDPAYRRSTGNNYVLLGSAAVLPVRSAAQADFARAAQELGAALPACLPS